MLKDYFKVIDTEEKAYWLGFIFADGCIPRSEKYIVLDLHIKDIQHLNKFKTTIQSDISIKIHGNQKQYAKFVVSSTEMCSNLISYGCVPKKSLILQYPHMIVNSSFEKDFLRGYFDGDGCLSFSSTYQNRKDRNPYKKYKREHWLFSIRGTKEFLTGMQMFLPVQTSIKQLDANKNACYIKCGGNQKIKYIMNSLYADASVYLDRKYELYNKLINY